MTCQVLKKENSKKLCWKFFLNGLFTFLPKYPIMDTVIIPQYRHIHCYTFLVDQIGLAYVA